MKIVALLDKKSNVYMPFLCPNALEAKRSLFYELNNGADSLVNKAPNDYSLWLLGEVNDNGSISTVVSPLFIEECCNLIEQRYEMVKPEIVNIDED